MLLFIKNTEFYRPHFIQEALSKKILQRKELKTFYFLP
jgi:hypothetical protein